MPVVWAILKVGAVIDGDAACANLLRSSGRGRRAGHLPGPHSGGQNRTPGQLTSAESFEPSLRPPHAPGPAGRVWVGLLEVGRPGPPCGSSCPSPTSRRLLPDILLSVTALHRSAV